jgi:hypothetical protein
MNYSWQQVVIVTVLVFLFYFLFGEKNTLELLLSLSKQEFMPKVGGYTIYEGEYEYE